MAAKPQGLGPIDDIVKAVIKQMSKAASPSPAKKVVLKKQIKKAYPMTTKSGVKLDKSGVKGMRKDKYQGTVRNYRESKGK